MFLVLGFAGHLRGISAAHVRLRSQQACFRGKLSGRLGNVRMRRVDVAVMRRRDAAASGVIPLQRGIIPGTGQANE